MALGFTPDHRHAGGVAEQARLYTGMSGSYNQYYATGGAWGQLVAAAGPTAAGVTYNQYAPGGAWNQFMAAATGPAGVTGLSAEGVSGASGANGPTGTGP